MPSGIDWCDETINPQGWGCWGPGGTPEQPQRCWYCYVERQAKGPYVPDCELCRKLVPHWHPDRLKQPRGWMKPRRIFWQSMGDLMHPCTPAEQIGECKAVAEATPRHTHIFCTKNPARYAEFNPWPANCWLLTTITGGRGREKEEDQRIFDLLKADCRILGLSIEPLLGKINLGWFLNTWRNCTGTFWITSGPSFIHWLIIGAYTGKNAAQFQPRPEMMQSLIAQSRAAGVPLFLKKNLRWPVKIQEWPE